MRFTTKFILTHLLQRRIFCILSSQRHVSGQKVFQCYFTICPYRCDNCFKSIFRTFTVSSTCDMSNRSLFFSKIVQSATDSNLKNESSFKKPFANITELKLGLMFPLIDSSQGKSKICRGSDNNLTFYA